MAESSDSVGSVLFVGSVPGDNVEHVFGRCASAVGEDAFAFPDGELGPRQMWVAAVGPLVYAVHPGLEQLEEHVFTPREGDSVSLDDYYPYTDLAIESYRTFARMRDAGEIPAGAKFQVSLPTPHAAVYRYYPSPDKVRGMMKSWAQAMRVGYERMLAEIPAGDLVVQLDYCTELIDITTGTLSSAIGIEGMSREERLEFYTSAEYVASFTEGLPETVALGYHICFGTYPQWPVAPQEDLGLAVAITNSLIANTPRRVDFLHISGMPDAGQDYYQPLRDLDPDPKLFLGLECGDGVDALKQRIKTAGEHVEDFGISHYCGYGRDKAEAMDQLLADLAEGASTLRGQS